MTPGDELSGMTSQCLPHRLRGEQLVQGSYVVARIRCDPVNLELPCAKVGYILNRPYRQNATSNLFTLSHFPIPLKRDILYERPKGDIRKLLIQN